MNTNRNLLGSGWSMVIHNKRYIFWFWLLNVTLAEFGTSVFRQSAHPILDHSLYSQRLLNGFHLGNMIELFARPEFPSLGTMARQASFFAFLFFLFTAIFLPGVFAGYASSYRLPREDFFRACGRNLWRFIRLMLIAGIIMGIVAGALFAINGAISKKAAEGTNELLPVELQMTGLAVIFLVMTTLRAWFDLAEADVVLNDQRAVRKSISAAFRHTLGGLFRLLPSYIIATILAAIFLLGGLWFWRHVVPPVRWGDAFVVSQITLFLLLIPRFWQRGIAVAYWQRKMMIPVVAAPAPVVVAPPVPPAPQPEPTPSLPSES